MLQGGKAAHQQTSDDDGQRGELVKSKEEEEHGLEVTEAVRDWAARLKCVQ